MWRCNPLRLAPIATVDVSRAIASASPSAPAGAPARDNSAQMSLQGLRVAAYFENSETASTDDPIAIGKITAQISESVYAVSFKEIALSPVIEVGSRVYVTYGRETIIGQSSDATPNVSQSLTTPPVDPSSAATAAVGVTATVASPAKLVAISPTGLNGTDGPRVSPTSVGTIIGGLVAKVNGNGTFAVLLDNDRFDLAVPREMITLSEGRSKFISNEKFQEVLEWVKSAGVDRRSDQESTSCILFHRGWRADKLYLLESADVHCLSHLNKSVRMSVLEKSEWERDQHRQKRDQVKERIKEKELRYVLTKYSGVFSACVAVLGVMSVFGWNFKNYKKQQRSYQLASAAAALAQHNYRNMSLAGCVERGTEEQRVRQTLRQLDVSHPRILVITGFYGCGKSILYRSAIRKEKMPAVFVDIRSNEDPLRTIVKSLGVQNIDACGDLLDFLAQASERAKKAMHGVTPLLVLKLREGSSLMRIYNEAIALACDRRLCHVIIEVPIETLSIAMSALPRLDFTLIPNFNMSEAFHYTQHLIEPLDLAHFIEVVGTNSNDLDELFAAVQHGHASATAYTNHKLIKAMRQLQAAWAKDPSLKETIINLAKLPFEEGQSEGYDYSSLRNEALRDIVMYNPIKDVWMFNQKVFHTAAQCWQ